MQSKDNACTKEISVFHKVYSTVSLLLKAVAIEIRNPGKTLKMAIFRSKISDEKQGDSKLLLAINFLEFCFIMSRYYCSLCIMNTLI